MASLMLPPPGSRSRVLRHLKHMEPLRKKPGGKFADKTPFFGHAFVQPKDRIAFWNIAPGDEVRVKVGGKHVTRSDGSKDRLPFEGIVDTVDRERSVVWLRASEQGDETLIPRQMKHLEPRYSDPTKGVEGGFGPNIAYKARPVHYSNLQLKLPSDLKLPDDVKLDLKKGVYATRLTRSVAKYDPRRGHFAWRRYAIVPTSEGTLKIEVPWKALEGRDRLRKENTTLSHVVDKESWLPWSPAAPVWLLPHKARTSPQALERHQATLAQRTLQSAESGADAQGRLTIASAAAAAAAKAQQGQASTSSAILAAASMIPGSAPAAASLPVYTGFTKQLLSKPKKPLLPQPPTPSEQVWMAKHAMRTWYANRDDNGQQQDKADAEANVEADTAAAAQDAEAEQVFSALDYLDITPLEGPVSAEWHTLSASQNEANGTLRRQRVSGRLADTKVTKRDLDSWPIELLMKDDLINETGTKHRTRRWKERQIEKAEWQRVLDQEEKANLKAFRSMQL